jgi:hypothetical protein
MPDREVAKGEAAELTPDPVITNPFSSRLTSPESHSVSHYLSSRLDADPKIAIEFDVEVTASHGTPDVT